MNLASDSYLFEHQQRLQFTDPERERMINEALVARRSHFHSQIVNFFQTLNHVRRIRIEVTFDYQESHPKTVGT